MFLVTEKCRIYAACGVSQTPRNTYNKEVIDALQERTDVTLITTFGEGEDAVTFTIPAGTGTTIVEEATALAASVEDAAGTASQTVEEEAQWYGFAYLTGKYAN